MEAQSNCDKALIVSMASLQRNIMLTLFGMSSADRTHMAEISIQRCVAEIVQAETDTKLALQEIVTAVRRGNERTESKNMSELRGHLMKSSSLRKQLCRLGERRRGMDAQMDKLRESELNRQMLLSMKHTNIALQNIGLKVSDADAIMLDLDEAQSDARDVQNSMSSSFANDEEQFDLEAELTLMLSEDALLATQPKNKAPANTKPMPVPDTTLLLPEVAQSTGKPPDEPPGAAVQETSAPLPVVHQEAVAPVSATNPTKKKARQHRQPSEPVAQALEAEALEAEAAAA